MFNIVFRNREIRGIASGLFWFSATIPALFGMMAIGPGLSEAFGIGIGWSVLAGFAAIPVLFGIGLSPQRTNGAIELDFAGDQLRVLRNGRTKVTRQLTRLTNLTIEPHPQAMVEHQRRGGKIGPFQKTHCLFGFFGAGGAEKVLLVCRWEFPSHESLLEVLKAVQWVVEKVNSGFGPPEETGEPMQRRGGIKPPLD